MIIVLVKLVSYCIGHCYDEIVVHQCMQMRVLEMILWKMIVVTYMLEVVVNDWGNILELFFTVVFWSNECIVMNFGLKMKKALWLIGPVCIWRSHSTRLYLLGWSAIKNTVVLHRNSVDSVMK